MLFAVCMMPLCSLSQRALDRVLYVHGHLARACGFAGQTPVQSTFSRFIGRCGGEKRRSNPPSPQTMHQNEGPCPQPNYASSLINSNT